MSNTIYGYARVSTIDQNLDRQLAMLHEYGVEDENIYTDKMSGKDFTRDGFNKLCEAATEGDTIIVESLNRVGRKNKELLTILEDWQKRGITFMSIKEKIDMSTPTGTLLTHLISSIAEFEASNTRERTMEGLAVARMNGRIGGRPKVKPEVIQKALKLYRAKTHSIKEICEICGISTATLYRYKKEDSEDA